MLVLARKVDESIVIDVPPSDKPTRIVVQTVDIRGDKTRLGFVAPRCVKINREEIEESKAKDKETVYA